MKNINKTIMIFALIISRSINAAPVGTGFNYQGNLEESGQVVNSPRVFSFSLFDASTGGNQVGTTITSGGAFPPVIPNETGISVNDGLFNVSNLDFGDQYNGDELWLEVSVKIPEPEFCGGILPPCPVAETLSPRQKIKAVPYAVQADYLGPIGASNGDVLTFSAGQWSPAASSSTSPWTENGSNVSYDGTVGIGGTTIANVDLFVNSDTGRSPLLVRINSIPKLQVNTNGGTVLGFVGVPPVDGLLVQGVSDLRDNVLVGGNLGIGTNTPTSLLHVSGPANSGNIFSVDQGGVNKMRLHPDGSIIMSTTTINNGLTNFANTSLFGKTAIGTNVTGTDATHRLTVKNDADNKTLRLIGNNGILGIGARINFGDGNFAYIDEATDDDITIHAADIVLDGDIKQPINENGAMKYMVHATCGNSASSAIEKSYNGVGSGTISIASSTQAGRCTITFPDNISNRYMQVSPLFGVPGRAASCVFSGTNNLACTRFNPSTLAGANGQMMILVY